MLQTKRSFDADHCIVCVFFCYSKTMSLIVNFINFCIRILFYFLRIMLKVFVFRVQYINVETTLLAIL